MKIIICGKIGAGKTTATKIMRTITGTSSIDADDVARSLYRDNNEIRKGVEKILEEEIIDKNGNLKKELFRKKFRENPGKIKSLDELLHPAVEKILIENLNNQNIFIETPVFLEKLFSKADRVLEIRARKEIRKKRSGFANYFFEIMDSRQENDFGGDFIINNEKGKLELELEIGSFLGLKP